MCIAHLVEIVLQNEGGCSSIDPFLASTSLPRDARIIERPLRTLGRKAFVPLDDFDFCEPALEPIDEWLNHRPGCRFIALRREGPTYDDGFKAQVTGHRGNSIQHLSRIARIERLGEHVKRIGYRYPDPLRAVIDSYNARTALHAIGLTCKDESDTSAGTRLQNPTASCGAKRVLSDEMIRSLGGDAIRNQVGMAVLIGTPRRNVVIELSERRLKYFL